ncbi:MFS transporter [Paracoccus versutus]|uniref:Putative MFS family arabinose efflux permease n=1 Tax=Paracoccus versutus TaxID=34007 RepID=A0A3D9XQ75_PARVE|nr:MFS transporter [Paracoccus versutus]REF72606.1 putative MFS family arabinose efflux permease [Paracoccus versutus]WGR55448.1 MFS transporter [Paracoccus versutus]
MIANPMHRQVLILASAQALFQTVSVLVMTVGGLAGAQITPRPELATLPIAAMFLGTALMTFPASHFMAKAGRRAGFLLGAGLGIAGGVIAAAGIWTAQLYLLSLGTLLVGAYQAFAQFYRFAASEVADDAFRPRAISFVMAGGVVAALLGPLLGRLGGPLMEPAYLGSFLILALVSLIAAGALTGLKMPDAKADHVDTHKGRPWAEIVLQPAYLVALFGAATGYGIMILAMTATPIAMQHHHHDLATAATVIQLHVLGMFLPSFFTGSLIARFGVLRIMLAGVLILTTHVVLTFTGTGFTSFASALVMLGVGWNFLYIGGTTLLTTTYTPAEKSRAQATNDMTIFVVGLACSFSAGGLLQALGWQTLNAVLLPWLGLAALALIWFAARGRAAQTI